MRHSQVTMTEQQFTNSLLEWAKVYGWRRFHVRNSGARGLSQVQGDKGFPDLVLVRPPRLIFAELKVGRNKVADAQSEWLTALNDASLAEVYYWTPAQWTEILRVLSR